MVGVRTAGGGRPLRLTLHVDDIVAIGETHMILTVTPADGGGLAIGVVYVNAHGDPIPRTYAIGISDHYVTVVRWDASGRHATRVYRHAVE